MSIKLTVQLAVQEGKGDEFQAAAAPALARVKAEDKGCEMYDLFRSVDDGDRFVMVESWESQDDLDAHMKSPAMGDVASSTNPSLCSAQGRVLIFRGVLRCSKSQHP